MTASNAAQQQLPQTAPRPLGPRRLPSTSDKTSNGESRPNCLPFRRADEPSCDLDRFEIGSPVLDRLLGGGLAPGEVVEIYGERSSGRFSLALAALAAVTGRRDPACLVDLGNGFDPRSGLAAGIDLDRLLWVRPQRIEEVLTSAETLVKTGIPLVVIELGIPPIADGRGQESDWRRLAWSARENQVAVLISSPYRVAGDAARVVLESYQPQARWRGREVSQARLLGGLSTHLELRRSHPLRPEASPRGAAEVWKLRAAHQILGTREADLSPASLETAGVRPRRAVA